MARVSLWVPFSEHQLRIARMSLAQRNLEAVAEVDHDFTEIGRK